MRSQYFRAAEAIRAWVLREHLRPGTLLPSGQALAARFDLRIGTTLRACQVLISEGLLHREGYKLRVGPVAQRFPAPQGIVQIASFDRGFNRLVGRVLTERGINHRAIEYSWTKGPILEGVLRKTLADQSIGLILSTGTVHENAASILEGTRLPMVVCGEVIANLQKSSVQTDIHRGTERAVKHLYDLGHRNLACVSEDKHPVTQEIAASYREACHKLNLPQSASMIWQAENLDEVARHTLLEGRQRHPEVTALVGSSSAVYHATKLFAVPEEISVVGLNHLIDGLQPRPPLTIVALRDPAPIAEWACTELISQIQAAALGLPPRAPCRAFLVPDLLLGKSTKALGTVPGTPEILRPLAPDRSDLWGTWQKTYPFLKENGTDEWLQLDLSKLANHSRSRQNGWLGAEPLEHFPPGLRSIHGVPFEVLDEDRNDGLSVITFRSPHTHSARTKQLPTRAKIRVKSRAKAVYFLHGCGYASPVPFAEYVMHYKGGDLLSQPLIPLGFSRRLALDELGKLKPNLQDWWTTGEWQGEDFPHAHHLAIFNPVEPADETRSLYSLEWINPRPADEIEFIEVRVDAKAGPVLALIAITVLL